MPFCNNCGQQYLEGAPFCNNCGAPLNAQQTQTPMANQQQIYVTQNSTAEQPKKKKKGCLIAVLVLVGLALLSGIVNSGKNKDRGQVSVAPNESTTPENSEKEIVDSAEKEEPVSSKKEESSSVSKLSYEVTDTNFNYYTNSIGTIEYYGYVEILNTGTCNIYLDNCVFDLEDNDGHLLQSDDFISSCPDVIAPGEKGYFYNGLGACTIDSSVSFDSGIQLVPNYQVEEAIGEIVEYDVSDVDMRTDDYGNVKITGRVTNNTDKDDSMVYINFILYDENGKVLAIDGVNVMELNAGTTKSFEGSTMFADDTVTLDKVASYKLLARKTHYQF